MINIRKIKNKLLTNFFIFLILILSTSETSHQNDKINISSIQKAKIKRDLLKTNKKTTYKNILKSIDFSKSQKEKKIVLFRSYQSTTNPIPERKLISQNRQLTKASEIFAMIKAKLPTQYKIILENAQSMFCQKIENININFTIKVKNVQNQANPKLSTTTITFTNTPYQPNFVMRGFHGSYRYSFPVDTPPESIKKLLEEIFPTNIGVPSKIDFFRDLEKFVSSSMNVIIKHSLIEDLIKEIVEKPDIVSSLTAIRVSGQCAKNIILPCVFFIYQIDSSFGGIEVNINSRLFTTVFPFFNFEESFKNLTPMFLKELENAITDEAKDKQANFSYEGFITQIGESLPKICSGCSVPSEIPPRAKALKALVIQFLFDKPEINREELKAEKKTKSLANFLIGFYINMPRLQISHIVLDNERVQSEIILPINKNEFGKKLVAEGKSFVESSLGDFEKEDKEIILKLEDVKKYFQDKKETCKDGNIIDEKNGFLVLCSKLPVIGVYEITSKEENSIRIDFLITNDKSEVDRPAETGYVLAKVSIFDAFLKIQPKIETYLSQFQ